MIAARVRVCIVAAALTCAAATAPAQEAPRKAERPTTVTPRESCVTAECHPGVKAKAFLHGPINANACDSCHKLREPEKHTFDMVRSKEQVCTFCHSVEAPAEGVIHKPFAEGECLACHDPHGSKDSAMLRGERYADACMSCHKDITGAHDRVHGPASAGACGACHQPHASHYAKLLNNQGRDLCLRCHTSTRQQIQTRPVVHEPAKGDCLVCHASHATDQPGMLKDEPSKLCTGCHTAIGQTIEHATTQHAAVTTKRACLNCHTPHAGENTKLLREPEINLCLECHNTTISLKDGTKILNMKAVLEKGKSLHGAIAQQSCAACHEIHGGGHRRLLASEYPSEIYYPFSEQAYSLCFSCHDKQLVLQQSTSAVTGFRNGERNLHYVHVNKDKGRSCRTCHDSHAATRERHIRDEVPFGPKGWRLPITYEQLPDGGKCGAGCHAPLEYNRVKPLTYPAAKDGAWKGAGLPPPGDLDGLPPSPPSDPPPAPQPAAEPRK